LEKTLYYAEKIDPIYTNSVKAQAAKLEEKEEGKCGAGCDITGWKKAASNVV
jgi:hypothetical protein